MRIQVMYSFMPKDTKEVVLPEEHRFEQDAIYH